MPSSFLQSALTSVSRCLSVWRLFSRGGITTGGGMKTLATIEGQPVTWDGSVLRFKGRGRVDNDGSGPANGDPYHQNDTSLHHNGKPLNAEVDRFIVIPSQIIKMIAPIVLGSQAYVTYRGKTLPAVVGDIGPKSRLGECSTSLLRDFGINTNPNTGGIDTPELDYEIHAGVPAVVNGIKYSLQAS